MKKALRETQTLRTGCSKGEPKNFTPPQTPFPARVQCNGGVIDGESGIVVTDPQTHILKHTHRQDRLQYTAAASVQCNGGVTDGESDKNEDNKLIHQVTAKDADAASATIRF